jgi:hypothetical protein
VQNNTIQDDDTLQLSVSANKTYVIRMHVHYSTDATADFQYSLAFPSAPTVLTIVEETGPPGGTVGFHFWQAAVSGQPIPGSVSATGWMEDIIVLQNGANAGTFKFRWAQNTTQAINTTVLAGSYLEYKQVN